MQCQGKLRLNCQACSQLVTYEWSKKSGDSVKQQFKTLQGRGRVIKDQAKDKVMTLPVLYGCLRPCHHSLFPYLYLQTKLFTPT